MAQNQEIPQIIEEILGKLIKSTEEKKVTIEEIEKTKRDIESKGITRYKIALKVLNNDLLTFFLSPFISVCWWWSTNDEILDVIEQAKEKYGLQMLANKKRRNRILKGIIISLITPFTFISIINILSRFDIEKIPSILHFIFIILKKFGILTYIPLFLLVYSICCTYIYLRLIKITIHPKK